MPAPITGHAVGTPLPEFVTPVLDPVRIRLFAQAMNDPNPVHVDHTAARAAGLPGVIAPGGMAVVALAHLATRWAGVGSCAGVDIRLRAPIPVGSRLRCRGHVDGHDDRGVRIVCTATSEDGIVRAEGTVWVKE